MSFTYNLGISNSLNAELQGAMYAIEMAVQKGWITYGLKLILCLLIWLLSPQKLFPNIFRTDEKIVYT